MKGFRISNSITNRESISISKYLTEVAECEMISADKEVELTQRIKAGDEKALEEMVKANLRFVISVAKQYQNQGLTLPDLINDGNIGLIKAAKLFDASRGFKFISYAIWWIRQSIIQGLREQGRIVRLPGSKYNELSKYYKACDKFEHASGRAPRIDEISDITDIPEHSIKLLLFVHKKHSSIDNAIGDDDERSLLDITPDESVEPTDDRMMKQSLKKELEIAMSQLDKRERLIISQRFGINQSSETILTLEDIAQSLHITRERCRQIEMIALKKLKKHQNNLKQFLN